LISSETCNCPDHKGKKNVTEVGDHRYNLQTWDDAPLGGTAWRWICKCGSKGKWTYQSDNVPYHSWITHVRRKAEKIVEW
jgi:hypothetical protein